MCVYHVVDNKPFRFHGAYYHPQPLTEKGAFVVNGARNGFATLSEFGS